MNEYAIIKKVLRTEKNTDKMQKHNQYAFEVDIRSNKFQIRDAIQKIYNVKVKSVKSVIMPRKPKLLRREPGYTSERKKAFVVLQKGQSIDLSN